MNGLPYWFVDFGVQKYLEDYLGGWPIYSEMRACGVVQAANRPKAKAAMLAELDDFYVDFTSRVFIRRLSGEMVRDPETGEDYVDIPDAVYDAAKAFWKKHGENAE